MVIYHEVSPKSLPSVKLKGLKCTSRGAKSNDGAILKTDELLDKHRPPRLQAAGLRRSKSIYGYVGTETSVIDIQDGRSISLSEKIHQNNQVLLRLGVSVTHCWISDLDKYDAVKNAVIADKPYPMLLTLCKDYWNSVQPLDTRRLRINRPEVMINRDISPSAIEDLQE